MPPTCPRTPRWSSRPRSARTTPSCRWPASAASRSCSRGELLAQLCAEKRLIAVAGTHGKTTTAAMLAWALRALGADPAFFVGGEVPGLGPDGAAANAGWGAGEWVVAEADESDASFLELRAGDRGDHQRRDGPPLPLGVGGRAARRLRRVRSQGERRGRAAWRRRARPRDPGAPQRAQRPGRPRRRAARRLRRGRGRRGARRLPRRATPPRAEGQSRRRPHLRRLRASPDRGPGGAGGAAGAGARAAARRLPAAPLLADQGVRRAVRRGPGAGRRGRGARRLPGPRAAGRRAGRGQRPRRRPRCRRPDGGQAGALDADPRGGERRRSPAVSPPATSR